jgi:hypothetical protein
MAKIMVKKMLADKRYQCDKCLSRCSQIRWMPDRKLWECTSCAFADDEENIEDV